MFVGLAEAPGPEDQANTLKPAFRADWALPSLEVYLWVFIVTLSIHEVSNEGFILVHLSQAHPAER
jgi:hypothetical protein